MKQFTIIKQTFKKVMGQTITQFGNSKILY